MRLDLPQLRGTGGRRFLSHSLHNRIVFLGGRLSALIGLRLAVRLLQRVYVDTFYSNLTHFPFRRAGVHVLLSNKRKMELYKTKSSIYECIECMMHRTNRWDYF